MLVSFINNFQIAVSRICMAIISYFYECIFREKPNEDFYNFIKKSIYVGFGTFVATVFTFLFNIVAGRVFGPSGYGTFMLIQSIAMFLFIPMFLGLHTAMIKYCAETGDHNQRQKIISTTYIAVLFLTIISVCLYEIFNNQLVSLFSVNKEIFEMSIIFAVLFVFYTLTTSTLGGLHLTKEYALFQPIYGIIIFLILFIFLAFQYTSYKAIFYAMSLSYGIIGCAIVLLYLRKYLSFFLDSKWLSTLWSYSNLAVISGLACVLYTNIDRILINYYLGVTSVGIYSVYYISSFGIVGLSYSILAIVFLPMASNMPDKKKLYLLLKKICPYLLVFGIPVVIAGQFVLLMLFGSEYPIEIPLVILFAISAVLATVYGIFSFFFSSEGVSGARLALWGILIIAIVNIILNIIFIPRVGLYGAIGSTAVALAFGSGFNFYCGRKYFT
jgi:O-antigen/teichoic acid export membrane protein